jgi:hypothetical protein
MRQADALAVVGSESSSYYLRRRVETPRHTMVNAYGPEKVSTEELGFSEWVPGTGGPGLY